MVFPSQNLKKTYILADLWLSTMFFSVCALPSLPSLAGSHFEEPDLRVLASRRAEAGATLHCLRLFAWEVCAEKFFESKKRRGTGIPIFISTLLLPENSVARFGHVFLDSVCPSYGSKRFFSQETNPQGDAGFKKKIVKRGPVKPSQRDSSGWENNANHELDRRLCRLGVPS